jgi:hypothetical protein
MKILKAIILFLLSNNILVVERYKIEDIKPVVPIYWISRDSILVNEINRALIYNTKKREVVEIWDKESNQIYGQSKDKDIIVCQWKNRTRNSIEEYSTHLQKVSLTKDEILNIELKPTVEVLVCQERILLKTIPPIEEKFFAFTDDLYEIDNYENIDNIKKISPDLKSFITTDALNNIWILKFSFGIPKSLSFCFSNFLFSANI